MGVPHRTKPKGAVLGQKDSAGTPANDRASVQKLRTRRHAQVLIIGGGINGVGTFRDLALQGVDERNRLLRIAPHYVKPLQTTIPIFSTFSGVLAAPMRFLTHKQGKHTERGAFLIKLGLSMYDFFSRDGGTVPRHQFRGRKRALAVRRAETGVRRGMDAPTCCTS